jgi:hypothetical protein
MVLAASKLDLRNQLDNDLFNHITYVSNQCLLIAKKEGVDGEALTKMGKMLWRLFNVVRAYNSKKQEVTLEKVLDIIKEFKSVFSGA